MILYHLGHYGFLSRCIDLHIGLKKQEPCIILLDHKMLSKSVMDYVQVCAENITRNIGKIIFYSEQEILKENNHEERIEPFFDSLLENNKIHLEEIDEIIVGVDTLASFEVYLCMKERTFSVIEMFSGQFVNGRYGLNSNKQYDDVIQKYDCLQASNHYITLFYLDGEIEYPGKRNVKVNYKNIRNAYSTEVKKLVLDSVDPSGWHKKCSGDYALITFSSQWIRSNLNMEEWEFYYAYMLVLDMATDTFVPVLLKPHPNSDAMVEDYPDLFYGYKKIPAGFPSQYLSLCDGIHISLEVASNSTGKGGGNQHQIIDMNLKLMFLNRLRMLPNLLALFYCRYFFLDSVERFHHYGGNREFLTNILNQVFGIKKDFLGINPSIIRDNIYTIIDDITDDVGERLVIALENSDENTKIMFLNHNKKNIIAYFQEKHKNLLRFFIPIRIYRLSCNGERTVLNTMYFFTKDEVLRQVTQKSPCAKNLPHLGCSILMQPIHYYEDDMIREYIGNIGFVCEEN